MAEAIHCPECNKKYSLPANPPATFTCRQCGTLMDLSDFGGTEAPPKPARPSRGGGGGPPRSRRQRARGGAGGAPAPSRGRGSAAGAPSRGGRRRGGRGAAEEQDEGPGGRRGARGRKDNNNALIIGSAVALVVVVGLVLIIVSSQDDPPAPNPDTAKTGPKDDGGSALTGLGSGPAAADTGTGDAPQADTPKSDTPKADTPKSDTPKGDAPKTDTPKAKDTPTKAPTGRRISSLPLQSFPWPEDVDAETRSQVEDAIKGLYRGGRDALDAKDFLQQKGRIVAGRLISEFKTLDESPGFDSMEGRSLAGTLDSVLRSIDGYMERRHRDQTQIKATSRPSYVLRVAKRWTGWWKHDLWKEKPLDPWDPFEDSFEKKSEKKKDDKGTGFRPRAGR